MLFDVVLCDILFVSKSFPLVELNCLIGFIAGGMTQSVVSGYPKMKIEEAATRRQADIDSGKETIVGVNKYRLEKEDDLDVRKIDNSAVLKSQVESLKKLRASRDNAKVEASLKKLEDGARNNEGNLLELSIDCARNLATVGEISDALERVFGRFSAKSQLVEGAYVQQYGENELVSNLIERAENFANATGRRPRILVAKLGQDGHDRGAHVIASGFADHGWDVDVGPLFQTPSEVVRQALDSDVHVIGVSSQAAGHRALVPALVEELKKEGMSDVIVVCGGVIPASDYDFLKESGVSAIFGPGTKLPLAVDEVLNLVEAKK